jgi:hypothetical protein
MMKAPDGDLKISVLGLCCFYPKSGDYGGAYRRERIRIERIQSQCD